MIRDFRYGSFASILPCPTSRPLSTTPDITTRLLMADRTGHRIHSEECSRVDWRSTPRYAATAKRRWERAIVRLLTLRKWSAQRLVQHGLSSSP